MDIKEAVKEFGTPLYIYNIGTITERYRSLKTFLPESFELYYALKANGNLSICKHLARLGCGADISSLGELATALKAGFSPGSILFTGPGKSDQEIRAAIRSRVSLIVIESLAEGHRVNAEAQSAGVTQDVILRINPARQSHGGELEISSHLSKFGVEEERAAGVMKALTELERLCSIGIHVYTQSNVLEHQTLLESHAETVALANRLREAGHPITMVDFGGGIGVPYSPSERSFDMRAFGDGLAMLIEKNPHRYRYAMEVGRYFVSESGTYVSRIIEIRRSRGKTFLIIDGGINHIYRPLMRRANKYLEVVGKRAAPSQVVSIAGPLATPDDVLVEDVLIPGAEAGDLLLIRNCGAYTFSHSLLYFSLHPLPAEVAYDDGNFHLIRGRGSVEDFFLNQKD